VTKNKDGIKFYENQKGPRTATMMGRDKQFVDKIKKKKLKRTAPAEAQSSVNQDDFQDYSSDTTSSLSYSNEESDYLGFLTLQKSLTMLFHLLSSLYKL